MRRIILSFVFLFPFVLSAQKAERKNLREGNKQYNDEKYTEAEISYRRSLEVNPTSEQGIFNLGNALFKQEKYNEAGEQYKMSAQMQKDPTKAAAAWHNLGNISSQAKDYAKSIEAYKQALRLNPNDDETRYNLVLAQKLLQEQQNQQNQDQEKDNQQQEENKDDQNKDQQNQPQQQDQNQQNQDEQNQQQQDQQMSKENAEQILEALQQDEKATQDRINKEQMKQVKRKITEKDW